ncbi:nucleotidyltransferase domain-containing protein [Nocardioides cynanchi]|uniref:nucleotidyltransferase domain-containing protein n=1 Tax=Nocardioides cynanchi TaxID=2558918 RepID=UPI0012456D74|nr:nucleotidyltransferase domain-containing protein [Nocardioides cynanchi]
MDVDEAIAPLEPGYDALLARVVEVLEADARVRALWLSGSVGRGAADAGSDLDLVVTVVSPAGFTDPTVWAVLDPVITTPIPGLPGCFAFTTREGLRVDVVLETPADVAGSPYSRRVRVFDRDGLEPPSPDVAGEGPDLERMQAIVTEFHRQAAIFPAAVVAREDWLLGQSAVHHYRTMLYDLFVEANQPLPVMGVKQWSSRLNDGQREVLRALVPPAAEREPVTAAMVAVAAAIAEHGRAALEAAGGVWPDDVSEAIGAYWARHGLVWPAAPPDLLPGRLR